MLITTHMLTDGTYACADNTNFILIQYMQRKKNKKTRWKN